MATGPIYASTNLKYVQTGDGSLFSYIKFGRNGFEHVFNMGFSDDPNSTTIHPLSEATFALIRSWIEQCLQSHGTCSIRYNTGFKPTRLIDVAVRGTPPRLIGTSTSTLEDSRYLALSHRWGPSMPECATTKIPTLRKRLTKIPFKSLPKTFRHAITVTRRIGLRYLWIDSLCILQDSPEDWQRESASMRKVYAHSYSMIAAAAADDCSGGLFPLHDELPILRVENESLESRTLRSALIKPRFGSWDDLFNVSKLNRRGWTLQERELSPRIVYFTKHTMLFECREARGGDPDRSRYPFSWPREYLTPKWILRIDRKMRRCLDLAFSSGTEVRRFSVISQARYDAWMDMVEGYSERKLTMPTDKFAGVSGLASEFAYLLDDQYIAGLWRKDLCRGLCWRWKQNDIAHTPTGKKLKVQAMDYGPSWSWAKMAVPISYDLVYEGGRDKTQTTVDDEIAWGVGGDPTFLDVCTVPEGKDPNGTLISATIHLEGLVFSVKRLKTGNLMVAGDSVLVTWDFLPQTTTQYHILSMGRTRVGLVLIPTELNDREYRRAGVISSTKREWFKEGDLETLTLV